jgi:hypothetical protein
MFLLYVPLIAIGLALLAGGHLDRLGTLRLRGLPVVAAAMAVQALLFGPLTGMIPAGDRVAVLVNLAAMLAVIGVLLLNRNQPALVVIAVGAIFNCAAIMANGGLMPASPEAMAALGWLEPHAGFSNSELSVAPALPWLTDVFALPRWLPFANVFSIGDVLIGTGMAWLIWLGMTRPSAVVAPSTARAGR